MKSVFRSRPKINILIIGIIILLIGIWNLYRPISLNAGPQFSIFIFIMAGFFLLASINTTIILTEEKIISKHPLLGFEKSITWDEIENIEEKEIDTRSGPLFTIISFLLFGWIIWLFYGSKVTVTKIVSTDFMEITFRSNGVIHYDLLVETLLDTDNKKNALTS